jgi:aldehyde:ferredoxin oxidoreductase
MAAPVRAVMGSKNLKAAAVRGKSKKVLADPEKVRKMAGGWARSQPTAYPSSCTTMHRGVIGASRRGTFPGYNYNEGQLPRENCAADHECYHPAW